MRPDFDLAILGSGFSGSLLALIARRLGLSVILIERDRHPRFAIGESSTPLANLLLESLAVRYDLPELLPFTKWGTWQERHPDVACGLKRGFTFFHHRFDAPWSGTPDRDNELLVAASPRDAIADTHWYRPDFDQAFAGMAVRHGAELLQEARVEGVTFSNGAGVVTGRTSSGPFAVRSRLVLDATGPRGCLHRLLSLGESPCGRMPITQTLFTHFRGVQRWDARHRTDEAPPYPVDDAAVHHVFDGGWIWVLRFNNGLTSAGAALEEGTARLLSLEEGAPAWVRLLERLPSVREQFAGAEPTLPFRHWPRLSSRTTTVTGEGWALLPSAAGFVDPLLSTGFPLTLLGVERLGLILERDWNSSRLWASLESYAAVTLEELDRTAHLIAALYANMKDFEVFRALTLLYFAAASFSETARRLQREELARGFLLGQHPQFGPGLQRCVAAALELGHTNGKGGERGRLLERIRETIDPVNVAGLGDVTRRNWYPARAADLLAATGKLGASRGEIEALLHRTGFAQSSSGAEAISPAR